MIGNTIEFYLWPERIEFDINAKPKITEALVVDAFTKIKGSVSGNSETFLGFGEGKVHGSTNSERMYKVEYYEDWDDDKKLKRYKNIPDTMLIKIIAFAGDKKAQETNEEKIKEQ